ncbi:MAG: hypothetical protein JXK94_01065 [Deltaproteobacteria bacterium]|nr:hypothetical protein [Deltaproteobacteria bacterium]
MSMKQETRLLMGLSSMAGLIFCLANAMGADLLCITEGCKIYQEFTFFGINFYVLGALGFSAILLLLLLPPRVPVGILLRFVIPIGLLIEILLLGYMFLFWSCSSCLVAAFLFGLAVCLGILTFSELQNRPIYFLTAVWFILFFVGFLGSTKEVSFKPWSMSGGDSSVQVYFSPTCHRCEEVVTEILDYYVNPAGVAFYPVAKNEEDLRRLKAALPLLKDSAKPGKAIRALFQPGDPAVKVPDLSWRDRFRLLCNKIQLARMGLSTVPQVISTAPLKMREAPPFEGGPTPFFPDQKDESCSPFSEVPCP